jgi:hypothetical protein
MCRGANTYFFIAPNISMILECKNDVILDDLQCHDGFHWKLVPLGSNNYISYKKQVYLKPKKAPSYASMNIQ